MKLLLALLLSVSSAAFASNCKPELKFGTKVKIVSSSFGDYAEIDFVKDLQGNVVNLYKTSYTGCKNSKVVIVSVCVAPHKQCTEFRVCEHDLEVVK